MVGGRQIVGSGNTTGVANSVVTPNGLFGSMDINGMAVLLAVRRKGAEVFITETHPKVLFWHLIREQYNYTLRQERMNQILAGILGTTIAPSNEHEWDAALSAYAALQGVTDRWNFDLHTLPVNDGERIIWPGGKTLYCWPL